MSSSKKHIDFSRYVALGDSVTAGYRDGALFREGQLNSFPNLLACQFGCDFKQPLVDVDSVGIGFFANSRLDLRKHAGDASLQPHYIAQHGDYMALSENCYATQGPFNNFGIPGAKVITLIAPCYGNRALGDGNYNPFFARMCSNAHASVLGDAMATKPTFFSLFVGNNDVLAYALSGGTSDMITPLKGAPGIGFEESLNLIVRTLVSAGAFGAISNLPATASIPFFSTIQYNDLLLSDEQARALSEKYKSQGIVFCEGHNPFIAEDLSGTGSLRQLTKGELISLDVIIDEHKHDYLTGKKPLPKKYYLTAGQVSEVDSALRAYNEVIRNIAAENNIAFVDTHNFPQNRKTDRRYDPQTHELEYRTGGFFSLDGLHINSLGHALLANEFINAINETYGTDIEKVNLAKSRERC